MDKTRVIILVIATMWFLCACAPQFDQTPQPEKIMETVIVEFTSTPIPTQLTTEKTEVDQDNFKEYAETIFIDLYSSCAGLSQKDWESTDITFNLKIRADAEACVNLISTHEIPQNCEYDFECNQLSSLATEYRTLVTDGWRLFRKGEDTLDDDLVSEGIGMFWEADVIWQDIRDLIFRLVNRYGWEIHL